MIKYTAHPEVIRKYDSILRNSKKPWNDQYLYATEICGSDRAYFACGDFWKHYLTMEFYSPVERTEVPVNGVLIHADYFAQNGVQ